MPRQVHAPKLAALLLAGAAAGFAADPAGAQCVPTITLQPQIEYMCIYEGGTAVFTLQATGPNLTYQWQQQDLGDTFPDFIDINDGYVLDIFGHPIFTASGTNTNQLTLTEGQGYAQVFRCVVSTGCGHTESSEATLLYCLADINCSGAVTVQDIFDFLTAYFSGDLSADINFSGEVSVQDIFDYLELYFTGCD